MGKGSWKNKLAPGDSFQLSNYKPASHDVKHDKDPRLSRSDTCKADTLYFVIANVSNI